MSARLHVTASEQGVVRVFAIDLPAEEIASFTRRNGRWPLQEALGADPLEPSRVEIIDLADLAGLGLAGYLTEGMGLPADQIDEMRPQLEALRGYVLVLPSAAFCASEQDLAPRAPLRLIASFNAACRPVQFDPLPDESAKPEAVTPPARKHPSDAAMSGRIATITLLVLAILVAVMVWIA